MLIPRVEEVLELRLEDVQWILVIEKEARHPQGGHASLFSHRR